MLPQAQLIARIREIQNDATLSDSEKAQKRQELMSGKWAPKPADDDKENSKGEGEGARPASPPPAFDGAKQCQPNRFELIRSRARGRGAAAF